MNNNKETLENYELEEREPSDRILFGMMGLIGGTMCGSTLISKIINTSSEIYNYIQANPDVHTNLSQLFYNSLDKTEIMMYCAGIVMGGHL